MKRSLLSILIMLCISITFSSCEKEGHSINKDKLEGKWWTVERIEARFNGAVVATSPKHDPEWNFDKIYFDAGTITIDIDSDKQTFACSVIEDEVTIWGITFSIVKMDSKELVCDMKVGKGTFYQHGINKDDLANGFKFFTYLGKDIYRYHDEDFFWYLNNKEEPVECYCVKKESNLTDFLWEDIKDMDTLAMKYLYDYLYDSERYYFKAE